MALSARHVQQPPQLAAPLQLAAMRSSHRQRLGLVLPLLVLLLVALMYATLHAMSLNAAAAVHALNLASRSPAPHWPAAAGPAPIGSTAGSAGSGAAAAAASTELPSSNQSSVAAAAAGQLGSGNRTGGGSGNLRIPRLLHQNFLGGAAALERESLHPRSHFRRDWWRSCQVGGSCCDCARQTTRRPQPVAAGHLLACPPPSHHTAPPRPPPRTSLPQTHNPGWTYMLWDLPACEALLAERYPWFLDTWRRLPSLVLRSDAIRPFILHAHGQGRRRLATMANIAACMPVW
jgi:hypothetical protein